MTKKSDFNSSTSQDHTDGSDTLSVPPPNFRERLASAQRARARASSARPVRHALHVEKQSELQHEQVSIISTTNE
jgi:hypothetical protein